MRTSVARWAFWRDQRGVMTVLMAFLLPVLAGMASLVVDLGDVWQTRRHLQNCADAAAMAGAWQLGNQVSARTVAASYLAFQGAAACGTSPIYAFFDRNADGTSDAVSVTVSRPSSFGLARLIGINGGTVGATAKAGKITPSGFSGIEPFGVQVDPDQPCGRAGITQYTVDGVRLAYGQTYVIKYSSGGDTPGNFQALALGGTGADIYGNNIANGYGGWVSSCDSISTEQGNKVIKTIDSLDTRNVNGFQYTNECDALLRGDPSRWSLCPKVLNIVLIPPLANGRQPTQVLTFAWFYLLEYHKKGNEAAELTGIFLDVGDKFAPPEGWTGNNAWTPGSLPFGVKLLE